MTANVPKRLEPDTLHPAVNRPFIQATSTVTTNLCTRCVQQRAKNARLSRDRVQLDCLEQFEGLPGPEDPSRVRIRHRVRQMLSDVPAEENKALKFKGKNNLML